MRTENRKRSRAELESESEKENETPQQRRGTRSFPFKSQTTRYGRKTKSPRDPNFPSVYYDPFESKRSGGLYFRFAAGQVVPVFKEDQVGIKPGLSDITNYFSPSKTQVVRPGVRKTRTPRHRKFKRVGLVTVTVNGQTSEMELFQEPGNFKKRFQQYPPVINRTPTKVREKVSTPQSEHKRSKRFVTPEDIKEARRIRKNTSALFGYCSANEMRNAQLGDEQDLKTKYELSHMEQLGSGGQHSPSKVTAATEGHNSKRMLMVEGPGNQVITSSSSDNDDSQGLLCETEVDLLCDENGKLTHVGGKETTVWSDPTTLSFLEVELDSQNPERPTRTLGKMMEKIYEEAFLSSQPSDTDDEELHEELSVPDSPSLFYFR